ncbi:MAG: hypothetical protein OQL20_09990, partial [Sedimenticola sp.]|nr:hypothetical protein [Sedimenticola sp.]
RVGRLRCMVTCIPDEWPFRTEPGLQADSHSILDGDALFLAATEPPLCAYRLLVLTIALVIRPLTKVEKV